MSKTIMFCADGTWNGPAEPDQVNSTAPATNVFKLFANLAGTDSPGTLMLANEQERELTDSSGTILQVAKYLHGVGNSKNYLVQVMGGTIGAGLIVRIVRGYTFISRNYRAGDEIIINGFSRGAYTARALAGMIAAQGLLDATQIDLTDKTTAYRLGSAVWYAHLKNARAANADWLGRIEEFVVDLPAFVSQPPPSSQLIQAPIEAVAVWDTVGSLGIPDFTVQMARVDPFQFADTELSAVVKCGIHAIAVDELRADFTPTLWDSASRITQALFPGAHSDVGGGYPVTSNESGLSDSSLVWMTVRLTSLGVQFAPTPTFATSPSAAGPSHQPWTAVPWSLLQHAQRTFPKGLSLSQTLVDRLRGGLVSAAPGLEPGAYGPTNLADYLTGNDPTTGIPID